jgi:predicted transcriptional regulator YheO
MIQYSRETDLVTVITLINSMSEEDKNNFNGIGSNFFVDMTYFHYNIIKGNCLMFKNEAQETIGFVCFNINDTSIYISNLYIDTTKRKDSMDVLRTMFAQLKMYARSIVFKVNAKNNVMHKIAKYINAVPIELKDNTIKYKVHI